jgi:hypothetical protein
MGKDETIIKRQIKILKRNFYLPVLWLNFKTQKFSEFK